MTYTTFHLEWKNFADTIGGSISETKAGRFNPDNLFCIKTPREEVVLTWGILPAAGKGTHVNVHSVFRFCLAPGSTAYLNLYPKSNLGSLLSSFNKNRHRTGDPELDKAYIFIANGQVPLVAAINRLQMFHRENRFRSFFIDTDRHAEPKSLVVQVNELITKEEDLLFIYQFGKDLAEMM